MNFGGVHGRCCKHSGKNFPGSFFQYLSSLFLKAFTVGAVATQSGRLLHVDLPVFVSRVGFQCNLFFSVFWSALSAIPFGGQVASASWSEYLKFFDGLETFFHQAKTVPDFFCGVQNALIFKQIM